MGEEEEEEFELGICNMFVCRPCPERHPWSLRLEQPWQRRCVVEPASRAGTSKRRRTGQRERVPQMRSKREIAKLMALGIMTKRKGEGGGEARAGRLRPWQERERVRAGVGRRERRRREGMWAR